MSEKADIFVAHIDAHLSEIEALGEVEPGQKVCCKICNKDIDQIYEEEMKHKPQFNGEKKMGETEYCDAIYGKGNLCHLKKGHDGKHRIEWE